MKQSKENKTLEYTEEEKSPDDLAESSQNNVIRNSKTSRKEKMRVDIKLILRIKMRKKIIITL